MNLAGSENILSACAALVDRSLLDKTELELIKGVEALSTAEALTVRDSILAGDDPLGKAYMEACDPTERRSRGETYTPRTIVESMVATARNIRQPSRVIDAGCGSGRFTLACMRAFPEAEIVAVDASPVATLMCKTAVSVVGAQDKVLVLRGDFMTVSLPAPKTDGPTLWIGNPPYVRHHNITSKQKDWLRRTAADLGFKASGLSGLHAYFILSIAQRLREGDFGVLVTSAEWLDVKYGKMVRDLLTDKLGVSEIKLFDRTKRAFQGTDTTTVVFSFNTDLVFDDANEHVVGISGAHATTSTVQVSQLRQAAKWSNLVTGRIRKTKPDGYVQLGDFARVHRGIVTGANKFWVRDISEDEIMKLTIPVVSHARELMTGTCELETEGLSRLVVLPPDLDTLEESVAKRARELVCEGEALGVNQGYMARSRKCWWSIPVGDGATILMTYMARKAPVFVANPNRIRTLNVVHGIYPFVELSDHAISELVAFLNSSISQAEGRTYCGGLTKFEPREVESLWVPSPKMLEEGSWRS